MRSISFYLPIALIAASLAGCDGSDKGDDPGIETGDTSETGCGPDADGDGFALCEDCDDADAAINPGVEEACDGIDNNCDGEVDEDVTSTYYADTDGDGYGDPDNSIEACESSDGWLPTNTDCDDEDPYVHPEAEEICDGADNNCDGTIDEGLDANTYYQDSDADSYGNPDESIVACEQPDGYTDNSDDCDDLNAMEPVHADSVSGSPSGTGTMTNPLDTIQAAIDLSEKCVYAMPGTYEENIDFSGKDILVKGVDGTDSTYIIGTGETSVVTFANGESEDAILTGFTITGGTGTVVVTTTVDEGGSYSDTFTTTMYEYAGGGIYVNGAGPTLNDLVVFENELPSYAYTNPSEDEAIYVFSYGGGIYVNDGTVDATDVTLSGNYADNGGGLYLGPTGSISGLWVDFLDNSASSGGGASLGGDAYFQNSIFAANSSSSDGGSVGGSAVNVSGGSVSLDHVSAASNAGVATVYLDSSGALTMTDSILYDNDDGYMIDGVAGTALDVSYSDVYNSSGSNYGALYTDPTGASGNISADPKFTSAADLTLLSSSPAIGAASDGGDMGAYGGVDGTWDE